MLSAQWYSIVGSVATLRFFKDGAQLLKGVFFFISILEFTF